jgi:hypothetical protein
VSHNIIIPLNTTKGIQIFGADKELRRMVGTEQARYCIGLRRAWRFWWQGTQGQWVWTLWGQDQCVAPILLIGEPLE